MDERFYTAQAVTKSQGVLLDPLYIENRILIKNLKVSKFVKQTRDKQDIRGKNRKILETKQTKPTK